MGRLITAVATDDTPNGNGTCMAEARLDCTGWMEVGGPMIIEHGEVIGNEIVGNATRVWQDGESMVFEARIKDSPPGDLIWKWINDGSLSGISVGLNDSENSPPTDLELAERPELAGTIMVRVARLYEVSLVFEPANPNARITHINGVPTAYARAAKGRN